ncbi:MAG: hypothetical protein FJ121_01225 [Deltaproteobacteria bacterium]|nr:hypothetical protein [Deltaproteobacteria bacterium]
MLRDRKAAREALFEVIENQMKADNPPETKQTYHRLRAAGYSHRETMKMVACVVLIELNEMVRDNRIYDEAGYIKALRALPQLPWEEDEDDLA